MNQPLFGGTVSATELSTSTVIVCSGDQVVTSVRVTDCTLYLLHVDVLLIVHSIYCIHAVLHLVPTACDNCAGAGADVTNRHAASRVEGLL